MSQSEEDSVSLSQILQQSFDSQSPQLVETDLYSSKNLQDIKDMFEDKLFNSSNDPVQISKKLSNEKADLGNSRQQYQLIESYICPISDQQKKQIDLTQNESLHYIQNTQSLDEQQTQNSERTIVIKQHLKMKKKYQRKKTSKISNAMLKYHSEKEKRISKKQQSKSQRFIKFMQGRHFSRNFEQFYNGKCSQYYKNQESFNQASTKKKLSIIDKIIQKHQNTLNIHITAKNILNKQFQQKQRNMIIKLFNNIFRKVYIIMLQTQKRRLMKQNIQDQKLSSRYLDVQGFQCLYKSFDQEYDKIFHIFQQNQDRIKNFQYRNILYKLKMF